MADRDYLNAFAESLRKALGTPEGITEESVVRDLNEYYRTIFSAISAYSSILNHQDKKLTITHDMLSVDKDRHSASCVVSVHTPENTHRIIFELDPVGIQARQGYLATASEEKKGWWTKDQQDDFAERLGFAILASIGVGLSQS